MNFPPALNNITSNEAINNGLTMNNYTNTNTNNSLGSFRNGPVKATTAAINVYRNSYTNDMPSTLLTNTNSSFLYNLI